MYMPNKENIKKEDKKKSKQQNKTPGVTQRAKAKTLVY